MLLHGPIFNVVNIIEPKVDIVFLSSCDFGEERAAKNRYGWREIVPRLVKEDELPTCLLLGFSLEREKLLLASRIRRVIWFMVAEHIEDDFEFSQVFSKKFNQTDVLDVANVAEQRKILCCRSNCKDVVRRRSLQMKVRENFYFLPCLW